MCGIAGLITYKRLGGSEVLKEVGRCMANALTHRGPDDFGIWVSPDADVVLSHRRLAILDLSPAGHQPMISRSGRFVIVFNGEIYNFRELRSEIERQQYMPQWRGHSDTEVFLECIASWGVEKALQRARGMFAFALWDQEKKNLIIARDRIGEKPLYYGITKFGFVFASELKAVKAMPDVKLEVDMGSVASMLRYGYVPTPYSIYKGIFKLPPGTLLCIDKFGSHLEPESWWQLPTVAPSFAKDNRIQDDKVALKTLSQLLGHAVEEQMVADVPLGAFLSGGIDSSLIIALMQSKSSRPINTYTIGFENGDFDESKYASKIAAHLQTNHTEIIVDTKQAQAIIPQLPFIYDEPFADSSQIPTVLVCSMARNHVTVCLSGDGGDELFGGYNRHLLAERLWRQINNIPFTLRRNFADMINAIPPEVWSRGQTLSQHILPLKFQLKNLSEKISKFASVLPSETQYQLYQTLISQWRGIMPINDHTVQATLLSEIHNWPITENFTEQIMALDALTYLPDDILVKVDRAAMATSLETRVPFLDCRVIEFACSLALDKKIRNHQGKWLLRQLLSRYVPLELFDRPKQGFAIPLGEWLRGSLREWAEELLKTEQLEATGLNSKVVRSLWERHLRGESHHHALWNVLMYQGWRQG